MSAPDTNTEKQAEKHKAPLRLGIMLPIIAVLILFLVFAVTMFVGGDDPEGADVQVDGSGNVVDESPAAEPAAD